MENFFGIMKSELLYAKKYTSVHSLGSMNLSPMILGNCPYDSQKFCRWRLICKGRGRRKSTFLHFYIFTFLQRNTYLNRILNKEENVKCYIIIIIYYIIIYYNIIYNNFINGFLETLIMCKNPFLCKNVKM